MTGASGAVGSLFVSGVPLMISFTLLVVSVMAIALMGPLASGASVTASDVVRIIKAMPSIRLNDDKDGKS